jgi:ABC-type nitrate/sulfonate/bicarbonate transport system ATPase subunit
MPAKGADVIEIEAPLEMGSHFFPTAPADAAGVVVRDVSKTFLTNSRRRAGLPKNSGKNYLRRNAARLDVLDDVSFDVSPLEVVGILGPSGCGKSTLLELVAGLEQPSNGELEVSGRLDPVDRLSQCALMPQRDQLLPWRSAAANAALALELNGVKRAEAMARVGPLFESFGLAGFEETPPYELSGGMRQRVAFLRTLLAGKPVLLLDEPFGSLDSITRADMQEWLAAALLESPHTVVLVTHDTEEALFLCDRVLVLSARPGSVRAEIAVDLPRPRPRRETVTSSEFTALKERALEALA